MFGKRTILIFAAICLVLSGAIIGISATSTSLGLVKPAKGDLDWLATFNTNFQKINNLFTGAQKTGGINASGLSINGVPVGTSTDTYWSVDGAGEGGIGYASAVTVGGEHLGKTRTGIDTAITASAKSVSLTADIVLESDWDLSAYTGRFSTNGHQISGAFTFTAPADFVGSDNCFGSTVTVAGLKEAMPEWWLVNAIPGTTDMTTAFQAAVSAKKVILIPNQIYKVGKIPIITSVEIVGNQATLNGSDVIIFAVGADIDYFLIRDVSATFPGILGNQGREFFCNWSDDGVIGANITAFPAGVVVFYDVAKLEIIGCSLSFCKVSIGGDATVPRIENNNWISTADTVTTSPAYLQILKGDDADPKYSKGWILNNRMQLYGPTGANKDLIKIGNGSSDILFQGNHIENTNLACAAQLDTFTGGHRMKIIDNVFINTQIHRKQINSGGPNVLNYDQIRGNTSEFQAGHVDNIHMYLIGSLFDITENAFIDAVTTQAQTAIYIDNSDVAYDAWLTDAARGFTVALNKADFRSAHANSIFLQIDAGVLPSNPTAASLGIVSLNQFYGGTKFLSGYATLLSFVGNIWGSASGAAGTSFGNLVSGVSVGNVCDTPTAIFAGRSLGNYAAESIASVNTASDTTPSVMGLSTLTLTGGGTVTNLDDGTIGQTVTLLGGAGGAVIDDGAVFLLKGTADLTLSAGSTLTVKKMAAGTWTEIGSSAR